jgi:hypothetical protein
VLGAQNIAEATQEILFQALFLPPAIPRLTQKAIVTYSGNPMGWGGLASILARTDRSGKGFCEERRPLGGIQHEGDLGETKERAGSIRLPWWRQCGGLEPRGCESSPNQGPQDLMK